MCGHVRKVFTAELIDPARPGWLLSPLLLSVCCALAQALPPSSILGRVAPCAMVRRAVLLLVVQQLFVASAPRPGKEPAGGTDDETDSCIFLSEDDEDDDDLDPFLGEYEAWHAQCDAALHEQEERSRNAGGSCSAETGGRGRRLPANVVDEYDFALAVWQGSSAEQLMEEFAMTSVSAVKRLKDRLKLTFLRTGGERPVLPGLDELRSLWDAQPQLRTVDLAAHLGIGLRTLQRHMAALGFSPKLEADDEPIVEALRELLSRGWCSNVGSNFASSLLKTKYGIYATQHRITRCLQLLDPQAVRRRAKEVAKTKFVYSVPGPRSLYHIDAHEKLAKIWGIWIHICIDGYSRFIVYLAVTIDKYAETVRQVFLEAMNQPHPADPSKRMWASRVRGDKGSENTGWVEEQINRMGTNRGSVILGRSVQNCRAEYMWNRVKRHVTGYFRELFFAMQTRGLLDPSSPTDLNCLQAVFVLQVQEACDDFRQMWNNHHIRGRRTESGHGGGIPAELFLDPIRSEAVNDDDAFNAQGPEVYGVDEPIRGDDTEEELSFMTKHVCDPLDVEGLSLLLAIRSAYFEREPLDAASDGVNDYLRYRFVCSELLEALTFLKDDGELDWLNFGASHSDFDEVNDLDLRNTLAWLAMLLLADQSEVGPTDTE